MYSDDFYSSEVSQLSNKDVIINALCDKVRELTYSRDKWQQSSQINLSKVRKLEKQSDK